MTCALLYREGSRCKIAHVMERRAIGIVRVSATRGRGGESFHSPETQLQRIEDACRREGLTLLRHFEELDVSGQRPLARRPGLSAAVAALEAGQADVIVVAYFDRLVRSVKIQAEVAERVEKAGGDILTLDAGQITNGKAATKLQANMLGAVAQYWSDQTRDKVMEAQERAVRLGIPPWPQVPPGYLRGPDKRFVPDPKLAPVVAEMFERRARGDSINSLRSFLLEAGVKRTYGGIAQMLQRRVYVGEIHFGALSNLAAHEPIVDLGIFDRVQSIRVPRDHPSSPSDRLLARLGVVRCANCGGRLVVKPGGNRVAANGERTSYQFYWCRGPECRERCSISASLLEGMVVDRVRELVAGLRGAASSASGVPKAKAALKEAQAALDRAVRRFALAGVEGELVAIELLQSLRGARDEAERAYDAALAVDEAAQLAVTVDDWDHLSREEQRELVKAVIERVEVARGRGLARVSIAARVQ